MKNKGFTLIELLAVIVILAIIALIAVPVVLNMIENARKSAAKSSAYGYIDAINNNNELASMKNEDMGNIPDTISDGTKDVSEIDIKIKGKKPTSGEVTITNGRVVSADLCINNYMVNYSNNEATVGDKCSGSGSSTTFGGELKLEPSSSTKTYKGIVYLNPTNLSASCKENSAVSTTGTKSGCMKWYIYDDSEDTYKMLLDHNTTATVLWCNHEDYINAGGSESMWSNSRYTAYGPITATKQLKSDTEGWVGNPRFIKADEVAHIAGADRDDTLQWNKKVQYGTIVGSQSSFFYLDGGKNSAKNSYSTSNGWQKQVATSKGTSDYTWLFDYTNGCIPQGCNIEDDSTLGYWSSDAVVGLNFAVWSVGREGKLQYIDAANDTRFGIRPVIEIDKSAIN